jgi:hypothetical protein
MTATGYFPTGNSLQVVWVDDVEDSFSQCIVSNTVSSLLDDLSSPTLPELAIQAVQPIYLN